MIAVLASLLLATTPSTVPVASLPGLRIPGIGASQPEVLEASRRWRSVPGGLGVTVGTCSPFQLIHLYADHTSKSYRTYMDFFKRAGYTVKGVASIENIGLINITGKNGRAAVVWDTTGNLVDLLVCGDTTANLN